ncbi:hypothetical protein CK203_030685 [Vitis vinifera]|uniref:Uncharacterized protein n=1 Tax=Vitis vinifera TaxID=29760 RepID=A0A438DXE2_VITVI|nr:hypothetical protein CK203_081892 [Vitis vinifera]RVW99243.1 hypothetical protein CK203_030685 [Vitis vinifera]
MHKKTQPTLTLHPTKKKKLDRSPNPPPIFKEKQRQKKRESRICSLLIDNLWYSYILVQAVYNAMRRDDRMKYFL